MSNNYYYYNGLNLEGGTLWVRTGAVLRCDGTTVGIGGGDGVFSSLVVNGNATVTELDVSGDIETSGNIMATAFVGNGHSYFQSFQGGTGTLSVLAVTSSATVNTLVASSSISTSGGTFTDVSTENAYAGRLYVTNTATVASLQSSGTVSGTAATFSTLTTSGTGTLNSLQVTNNVTANIYYGNHFYGASDTSGNRSLVTINGMSIFNGAPAYGCWTYVLTGWTTAEVVNSAYTNFDFSGRNMVTIRDTHPGYTINNFSAFQAQVSGWYRVGARVNTRFKQCYIIMQPSFVTMATAPCTVATQTTSGLIAYGETSVLLSTGDVVRPSYLMVEASQGLGNWNSSGSSGYILDASMFWMYRYFT